MTLTTGTPVTLTAPRRALAASFPGWGHPEQFDHFVDHPAGTEGVVTRVEHHGNAPFTQFTIEFTDGSRAHGVDPAIVAAR